MKVIIKLTLFVSLISMFLACEKEQSARTPIAEITINKTELAINESMIIHFTGTADQVVIYTGDDTHNYDLRNESNSGFVVNKGMFTYAFSTPGVYKVVCVASTYTDLATELKQDTCSYTVTVTDDITEIDRISCSQVIYDEVFADRIQNNEWLMKLPRKVKYNTSTPSISLSQKLKFYIQSDSTKVFIDGNSYVSSTKYDLSNPVDILVKSNHGTTRIYTMYTIYYPEFATFKLSGISGTLVRSEFDYSSFSLEVTLPTGTNVSAMVPEFAMMDTMGKVYIGDKEQISGTSVVDFTRDVIYRLVFTLANNANVKAESTVKIKINYK